jgi:hypothetical protein
VIKKLVCVQLGYFLRSLVEQKLFQATDDPIIEVAQDRVSLAPSKWRLFLIFLLVNHFEES